MPRFLSKDYQYEKLTGIKLIRLLELQPSQAQTDQIKCNVRQVRVDSDVHFEALSYTWGNGKPTSEIQCNGARLFVRPNLETALRFLRHNTDTRTIWIDAICINQKDDQEREQQIPLMGDIYSEAWQVVAWIGEKTLTDAQALEIEQLQYQAIDPDDKDVTWKLENYITALLKTMMAAITLMRRSWFSRTWVIQEVALSKKLVLQCSDKVIRWSNFLALLDLLPLVTDKEGIQVYFGEVFLERARFVASIRARIANRRAKKESFGLYRQVLDDPYNVWQDLQSLVAQARPFGATIASDRIFGVLGLLDQKISKGFQVDYSMPYRALFREFARHSVNMTRSLSILSHADSGQDEKLESWVPDWTSSFSVESLSDIKQGIYSASGDSDVTVMPVDDGSVLALSGMMFDTIDQVKPGPSSQDIVTLNPFERVVAKGTQFGLAESTPLLPYKSIGNLMSKVQGMGHEVDEIRAPKHTIRRKPVATISAVSTVASSPTEEKSIDGMSTLSLVSTQSTQATIASTMSNKTEKGEPETITDLLARGIFTGLPRNPQVQQNHRVWGAIHPVNGVFMKTKLEVAWQEALPKVTQYPTGESIDEAYWRTLVGDKRTTVDKHVSQPPTFWQHAFRIWHSELANKQGNVSRFATHASSLVLSRNNSDSSFAFKRQDSMQHQELQDYFQAENAKRERINRSQQLQVPAFRNIISTLIKVFNISRPGEDVALGYSDEELTNLLDGYDDLTEEARADLAYKLSTIPTKRLSDDELRNEIDKAFWYDFVRVARNRQFCVTKKGYIGWVPSAAKAGDRICLFMGGQVPYVVRPHKKKKGEWQFLGEAYVHGIMRGEAMRQDGLRTETIKLR